MTPTDIKKECTAVVHSNEHVARNTHRITFREPFLATYLRAGQFVNIAIPQCPDILWRRPFSLHRADPETGLFEILLADVGRGTHYLCQSRPDQTYSMVGPLGNSFPYPRELEEAIIVAGGLGNAPFLQVLADLDRSINRTLFYGTATADQICCVNEFHALGAEVHLATEDGSRGYKGFVTEPFEEYCRNLASKRGRYIYCCGPTAMLKRVQVLAESLEIPAFVSVENLMGCGIGACMGCPVRLKEPAEDGKPYLLACTDGPVFPMKEIELDD
jgi:dihydroorotate dehydrogenase electron transfer subunit